MTTGQEVEEDDLFEEFEDFTHCQAYPTENAEDEEALFRDSWEDEDSEFYDQGVEDARHHLTQLPAVQMVQCAWRRHRRWQRGASARALLSESDMLVGAGSQRKPAPSDIPLEEKTVVPEGELERVQEQAQQQIRSTDQQTEGARAGAEMQTLQPGHVALTPKGSSSEHPLTLDNLASASPLPQVTLPAPPPPTELVATAANTVGKNDMDARLQPHGVHSVAQDQAATRMQRWWRRAWRRKSLDLPVGVGEVTGLRKQRPSRAKNQLQQQIRWAGVLGLEHGCVAVVQAIDCHSAVPSSPLNKAMAARFPHGDPFCMRHASDIDSELAKPCDRSAPGDVLVRQGHSQSTTVVSLCTQLFAGAPSARRGLGASKFSLRDCVSNRRAWLAQALHSLANRADCPSSLAFPTSLLGNDHAEVVIAYRLVSEFANARKDVKVCFIDEARQAIQRLRRMAEPALRDLDVATHKARELANQEPNDALRATLLAFIESMDRDCRREYGRAEDDESAGQAVLRQAMLHTMQRKQLDLPKEFLPLNKPTPQELSEVVESDAEAAAYAAYTEALRLCDKPEADKPVPPKETLDLLRSKALEAAVKRISRFAELQKARVRLATWEVDEEYRRELVSALDAGPATGRVCRLVSPNSAKEGATLESLRHQGTDASSPLPNAPIPVQPTPPLSGPVAAVNQAEGVQVQQNTTAQDVSSVHARAVWDAVPVARASQGQRLKRNMSANVRLQLPTAALNGRRVEILPLEDERLEELDIVVTPGVYSPDALGQVTVFCESRCNRSSTYVSKDRPVARFRIWGEPANLLSAEEQRDAALLLQARMLLSPVELAEQVLSQKARNQVAREVAAEASVLATVTADKEQISELTDSELPGAKRTSKPEVPAAMPLAIVHEERLTVPGWRGLQGGRRTFKVRVAKAVTQEGMRVGVTPLVDERLQQLGVHLCPFLGLPDEDGFVELTLINTTAVDVSVPLHTPVGIFSADPAKGDADLEFTVNEIMEKVNLPPNPTAKDREHIRKMLVTRRRIFATKLGWAHGERAKVSTPLVDRGEVPPPSHTLKRLSPEEYDALKQVVDKQLKERLIEPTRSPFCAVPMLVPKPDGSRRMVLDFRALNSVTAKDNYPLPNITANLDALGYARLYTTMDLLQGFFQIELEPEDRYKTAFATPWGQMCYNRLPMGLTSAPGTFMRVVDAALRGLPPGLALAFVDDIITATNGDMEAHMVDVGRVFDRLIEAGFTVRCDKVYIGKTEVPYLGFLVSSAGTRPNPEKTKALLEMSVAGMKGSAAAVARFVGMMGFYARFIPQAQTLLAGLNAVKGKKVDAAEQMSRLGFQAAVATLLHELGNVTALTRPDHEKPFYIYVDAATTGGMGAALVQRDVADDPTTSRPIAFWSRRFIPTERRYGVRDQECLALKEAVLEWHAYLLGRQDTVVYTDHRSLRWLLTTKHKQLSRGGGYANSLQQYQLNIEYIPGGENVVADCLSRNFPEPGEEEEPEDPDSEHVARVFDDESGQGLNINTKNLPGGKKGGVADDAGETTGTGDSEDATADTARSLAIMREAEALPTRRSQPAKERHVERQAERITLLAVCRRGDPNRTMAGDGEISCLLQKDDEFDVLPSVRPAHATEESKVSYKQQMLNYITNKYGTDGAAASLADALQHQTAAYKTFYPRARVIRTLGRVHVFVTVVDEATAHALGFKTLTHDVALRFPNAYERDFTASFLSAAAGLATTKPWADPSFKHALNLLRDGKVANAKRVEGRKLSAARLQRWFRQRRRAVKEARTLVLQAGVGDLDHSSPTPTTIQSAPYGPAWCSKQADVVEAVRHLLERLRKHPSLSVAVDLEGALGGTRPHISTIQISVDPPADAPPEEVQMVYVFDTHKNPLGTLGSQDEDSLRAILTGPWVKVLHCCHGDANALFRQFGIRLNRAFDTGLADCLLRGRRGNEQRKLDAVLVDYLGVETVQMTYKSTMEFVPGMFDVRPLSERLFVYAHEDVKFCNRVYLELRSRLEKRGLVDLAFALSQQRCPPLALPREHPDCALPNRIAIALSDAECVLSLLSESGEHSLPSKEVTPSGGPKEWRAAAMTIWKEVMGAPLPAFKLALARLRKPVQIGRTLLYVAPLATEGVRENLYSAGVNFAAAGGRGGPCRLSSVDRIQYEPSRKRFSPCSANLFTYLQVEAERTAHGQPGLLPTVRETLVASTATQRAALIVLGRRSEHVLTLTSSDGGPPLSFPSSIIKDGEIEQGLSLALDEHVGTTLRKGGDAPSKYSVMPVVSKLLRNVPVVRVSGDELSPGNTEYGALFMDVWEHRAAFHASRRECNGFQQNESVRARHPQIRIVTLAEARANLSTYDKQALEAALRASPPSEGDLQKAEEIVASVNLLRLLAWQDTEATRSEESADDQQAQTLTNASEREPTGRAVDAAGSKPKYRMPTRGEILLAQMRPGTFTAAIMEYLRSGDVTRDSTDVGGADLTSLKDACSRFELASDGVLLRKAERTHPARIALPPEFKLSIFLMYHDRQGHFGVSKCLPLVLTRFYWGTDSEMREDLSAHVRSCKACRRSKVPHHGAGCGHVLEVGAHSFDHVCMDHYETGVASKRGRDGTLGFACYLTRDVIAAAVEGHPDSEHVARVFNKYVVRYFGVPSVMVCDNATVFVGKTIKFFWARYGLELRSSSSYHHQTVGLIERFHQVLKALIRTLRVADETADWEEALPLMELAYAATVNRNTGYAPAFLRLGRHPRLPTDVLIEPPTEAELEGLDVWLAGRKGSNGKHTGGRLSVMNLGYQAAAEKLARNALNAVAAHNLRHDVTYKLKVADRVWLVQGREIDGNLPKAEMPTHDTLYTVDAVSDKPDHYILRGGDGRRTKDPIHVGRLILQQDREPDESRIYPVKCVIARRFVIATKARRELNVEPGDSLIEYRVWWTGWGKNADPVWRTLDYLLTITDLVAAYNSTHPLPSGYDLVTLEREVIRTPTPVVAEAAAKIHHFRPKPKRASEVTTALVPAPPAAAEAVGITPDAAEPVVNTEDTGTGTAQAQADTQSESADPFPVATRVEVRYSAGHGGPRWWPGIVRRSQNVQPRDGRASRRRIWVQFDDASYVDASGKPLLYAYYLDEYEVRAGPHLRTRAHD